MDWPEELLEIFDDPLLADVRPKPKAPTPDDRLAQKLLEVNKWVAEHGSEPKADGGLKENCLPHRSRRCEPRQRIASDSMMSIICWGRLYFSPYYI